MNEPETGLEFVETEAIVTELQRRMNGSVVAYYDRQDNWAFLGSGSFAQRLSLVEIAREILMDEVRETMTSEPEPGCDA